MNNELDLTHSKGQGIPKKETIISVFDKCFKNRKQYSIINKIDAKNYFNGQENISILNIYFYIGLYKVGTQSK